MKVLIAVLVVTTLTACTQRTQFIPECKDGVLTYVYKVTQVETGIVKSQHEGVLQYEDGTIVKCVK